MVCRGKLLRFHFLVDNSTVALRLNGIRSADSASETNHSHSIVSCPCCALILKAILVATCADTVTDTVLHFRSMTIDPETCRVARPRDMRRRIERLESKIE